MIGCFCAYVIHFVYEKRILALLSHQKTIYCQEGKFAVLMWLRFEKSYICCTDFKRVGIGFECCRNRENPSRFQENSEYNLTSTFCHLCTLPTEVSDRVKNWVVKAADSWRKSFSIDANSCCGRTFVSQYTRRGLLWNLLSLCVVRAENI